MALYRFIGKNDEAVFIIDEDRPGQKSVTNAAEAVTVEVFRCWGNRRIIYRDTIGNWDELIHENGWFQSYGCLLPEERARWQEWLLPMGEPA